MNSIAIIAVAGNKPREHALALRFTQERIPHKCDTILFTPRLVPGAVAVDRAIIIPDWGNDPSIYVRELSRFMLHELPKYIRHDFCICVQHDGYAVNADKWTDEFLNYDYIGAAWPWWCALLIRGKKLQRSVSGGFCLRSRRFLELSRYLQYDGQTGEDVYCARVHADYYQAGDCKFAPFKLSRQWATENRLFNWDPHDSFGFHGIAPNGKPLYTLRFPYAFWLAVKRSRYIHQHKKPPPQMLERGITGMYD